jgi:hypothetical protein
MIDEDCHNDPHHEHVQATTTLFSEERADNHEEEEEEMEEQMEPPPILNWFNDKDVSTEAHPLITISLETYHSPLVSSFQCLDEPSYVAIFEDSRTQDHTFRNRGPKRNFRSKFLGYIRWWNIVVQIKLYSQ